MGNPAAEEEEVEAAATAPDGTSTAASSPVSVPPSGPNSLIADSSDDKEDDNNTSSGNGGGDGLRLVDETPTRLLPPSSSSSPSSRFRLWFALTVLSAISLIALSTETDTKKWQIEEKWVLSVILMSLLLSSIASLAYILDGFFFYYYYQQEERRRRRLVVAGMPTEGLLLFTELGLWIGGIIVMMDTNNMVALDENGRILNNNLYFSSWAGLITTLVLLIGYGQEVINLNPNTNEATSSGNHKNAILIAAGHWAGVWLASLVALVASMQIFDASVTLQGQEFSCQIDGANDEADQNDQGVPDGFCRLLKFSIALGVISSLFAGTCTLFSYKMSKALKAAASFALFFLWALGVAFVTFGRNSPGNDLGNLYFSCWAAFVLSFYLVSNSIQEFLAPPHGGGGAGPGSGAGATTEVKNKVVMVSSDPLSSSCDSEKEDDHVSKSNADDEVKTNVPTEGPMTPNSMSVIKDGKPLEVPSEESTADPAAPFPSVNIPIPKV